MTKEQHTAMYEAGLRIWNEEKERAKTGNVVDMMEVLKNLVEKLPDAVDSGDVHKVAEIAAAGFAGLKQAIDLIGGTDAAVTIAVPDQES